MFFICPLSTRGKKYLLNLRDRVTKKLPKAGTSHEDLTLGTTPYSPLCLVVSSTVGFRPQKLVPPVVQPDSSSGLGAGLKRRRRRLQRAGLAGRRCTKSQAAGSATQKLVERPVASLAFPCRKQRLISCHGCEFAAEGSSQVRTWILPPTPFPRIRSYLSDELLRRRTASQPLRAPEGELLEFKGCRRCPLLCSQPRRTPPWRRLACLPLRSCPSAAHRLRGLGVALLPPPQWKGSSASGGIKGDFAREVLGDR